MPSRVGDSHAIARVMACPNMLILFLRATDRTAVISLHGKADAKMARTCLNNSKLCNLEICLQKQSDHVKRLPCQIPWFGLMLQEKRGPALSLPADRRLWDTSRYIELVPPVGSPYRQLCCRPQLLVRKCMLCTRQPFLSHLLSPPNAIHTLAYSHFATGDASLGCLEAGIASCAGKSKVMC